MILKMEKKSRLLILDNDFIRYCELNNIDDIENFAKDIFQRGFMLIKYGDKPKNISEKKETILNPTEKPLPIKQLISDSKKDSLYDE